MRAESRLLFVATVLTLAMAGRVDAGPTLRAAAERSGPAAEGSYHAYFQAAVRGDPEAQAALAALYAKGAGGVPQSDGHAFQWFMRAAGQGHAQAQLGLSEIFAAGRGVPRDNVAAYKWAVLAEIGGREPATSEGAARMIERLTRTMSEAQIVDARERVSRWEPKSEIRQHAAEPKGSQPVAAPRLASTEYSGEVRTPPAANPAAEPTRLRARAGKAWASTAEPSATRGKSFRRYMRARLMRFSRP